MIKRDDNLGHKDMADFDKNRFASKKQDWETPDSIFDPLYEEFHFDLDVAASDKHHKVIRFIDEKDNAMTCDWPGKNCWLNPPYGKGYSLSRWVERAYHQVCSGKYAEIVVMLIPARTNTNWFHDICLKYGEVRFIKGRPKFGGAKHGLPQPLCIVIFRAPR